MLAAALAAAPASAAEPLSCDEFIAIIDRTGRIGAAVGEGLAPEERCRRIPPDCGRGFTDNGRAWTWYYRSVCFERLAMERLDPALCDEVVERPSLLLNGSYYSPSVCRARIAKRLADREAGPMDPPAMARLAGVEAVLDSGLTATLRIDPARISGRYAVSLGLAYADDNGREVFASLNPEGMDWSDELERLHPLTGWHVEIDAGQEALTLTVAPRHLAEARNAIEAGRPVELEVRLQALIDAEGRVAAPDVPPGATSSRLSVRL